MSERIITLFGEEIVPQQPKPAAKSRAKKKPGETTPDENNVSDTPGNEEAAITPLETVEQKQEEVVIVETPVIESIIEEPTIADEIVNEETPVIVIVNEEMPLLETEAAKTAEVEPEVVEPEVEKNKDEKEKEFVLPEDWDGEKQYYAIGEVAELFKVKTSHIRFWTNEFKLKVRTTRKGDRLFTPDQIRELRAIHHLVKERGFTLNGARAKLKAQNKMDVETVDLKQSLSQLRNKLVIIRNQIN